jgi:gliding motility-associated-like protein
VSAFPAITNTYTVTGISTAGCSSSSNIAITVNPVPVITIVPGSITICPGDSISLSSAGATTYAWMPPTGLNTTSGAFVTANPLITTTYTVTGTTNGCTAENTITVNVNTALSVTVSPSSTVICTGSSTQLSASGASTYSWSPSAGLSTSIGSNVTANPVVTTVYTVTGITGGCSGTSDVMVTVNPNPVVTVTPDSSSICAGTSVILTAGGASTYSWTPTTGLNPTTGSIVTANPGIPTTYTVTGTTAGCSGTDASVVSIIANGTQIFVPNVFTPNADGLNDLFHVVSISEPSIEGMIFNRWGEMLFKWNGKNNGWDGTYLGAKVPQGVYVYVITSTDECGQEFTKYGTVSLFR